MKAFLYHEAGYVMEAKPAAINKPHADTPTAVFGFKNRSLVKGVRDNLSMLILFLTTKQSEANKKLSELVNA